MVSDDLNTMLEAEVTELEGRNVVFGLGNNRAPGIDGITSSFLKFYWEIIKVDVTRAILHFFTTNSMCESWKNMLVVLVPKNDHANMPSKFRPISLCQSFYKVVAKVLINRLKPILGIIISEEQGAFVPGRSISTHGLVAQEIISKFKFSAQKSCFMALKLDMEQAYDLFRQRGGQLSIEHVRNADGISHLLYADDILIFAEATRSNASKITRLLGDYCGWTGQQVNGSKSAILFNRKCPAWKKRMIAKLMGYRKVDSLEYLGLPLMMRKPVAANFGNLIRSAQNKTNLWGKKHLSYAGRALLIRTALLPIPMYLVTHTAVPHGVLNDIEKIARRFLWQKDNNNRGMHYVAWKELCQPRSHGGMGFYSSVKWQGALRARLAWDFLQNSGSLL
ncbi:uncharacterized protein LOC110102326 [Dendrobium catenatum]|uniref:uncharacterized protein LOC110102326 n=1 Tax=Dendrobium catenatum TaxID=906689 RepID=UPI0009F2176D|nr:uncharacterized protein LOC110102326 [Dendrobium catenatum]